MPLEKTWTERFEEKCQAETNHYKNEVLNLLKEVSYLINEQDIKRIPWEMLVWRLTDATGILAAHVVDSTSPVCGREVPTGRGYQIKICGRGK